MTYDKQKFSNEISKITYDLSKTLERKNADYGNNVDKNIDEWGLASLAIRLDDKLNRFKNLIKEGQTRQVSDEAIEDTLLDLAGYAILGYRKIQEMNGTTNQPALLARMEGMNLNIDRKLVDNESNKPASTPKTFTFNS